MKPNLASIALIFVILGQATIGLSQIKSISMLAGLGPASSRFESRSITLNEAEIYLHKKRLKPSSFTVNFLVDIALFKNKNLFIQTGMSYSAFGKGDPFLRDTYPESNGTNRWVSYRQDYSWAGLPLNFYYQLNTINFKPYISVGLGLNYFLDKSIIKENSYVYDVNNNLLSYNENIIASKRTNVQLWNMLALGVNCQFPKISNLGILIQVQYANQLTPTWSNEIDEKLKWVNFSLGVKYLIEKN